MNRLLRTQVIAAALFAIAGITTTSTAQTTLINPTGDGGFENGTTFAANGWTLVNNASATANNWVLNTGATGYSGARAAYISDNSAATLPPFSYVNTAPSTVHFYRDITFPAGETIINLGYNYIETGEASWDRLLIYISNAAPTGTPVAGTPASSSTTLTGYTLLVTGAMPLSWTSFSTAITAAQAGNATVASTRRLLFVWQNDGSLGSNPPVAIDNISLTSTCSNTITGITQSAIGTTTATLNWNTQTGATGYLVRYKKTSDPVTVPTWATPTATATNSLALTGLTSSTTYEYQVAAVGTTCGAFSGSTNFLTACVGPTVTTANATRCGQGQVTLSGVPSAGATTQWYTAAVGGTSIFTGPAFTPYLFVTTTYYAAARTSATCEGPRTAVTATITPAPAISVSSPQSTGVCTGTTVTVTATSANTGYKYTWTPVGVPADSGSTITRTPTGSTVFVVTATDTSAGANAGCVAKDSVRVNVNPKPPTPVISPNPATICQGSSIGYSAASVAAPFGQLAIRWINVTGLFRNAALTNPVLATDTLAAAIFAAPTTTQTYRAVSAVQGCSSDTSLPATVTVVPAHSTAVTLVSPSASACFPNTVTLSAPAGAFTYQWRLNGGVIAGATSQTYSAPVSGAYTVTVTSTGTPACTYTTPTANGVTVTINQPPLSNITVTGSTTFCTGGSATLTAPAAPTGSTYSYIWYQNGAVVPGATARTYAATAAGTYTVQVTNTTTTCTATTPTASGIVITISSPAAPITTIGAANTICQRDTLRLSTNNAPGLSYQWYLGGTATANLIPGATDSFYKASQPGLHYVIVSVTGQSSCTTTSAGFNVNVNPLPAAVISASGAATTFCAGGSVVLTAQPSGLTYQWRIGTVSAPIPSTSQTYAATTSGSYTAFITIPSTGCSTASNAIVVTVNPLPTATVTPAAATICAGGSTTLTGNTGTGLVYQWFNGTSLIAGATLSTYSATTAGSYTLRVTNANNCVNTSTASVVTVNSLPLATVTPTGATTLCTGDTLTLVGPTGTGYTYLWRLGAATAPGVSNARDYKATAAGSYTVVVTANSCPATSAATVVTALPKPSATVAPATATTACDSVVLSSAATGVAYQWRFNGNEISGANSATYVATASGNYSIKVTGTNGCAATTTTPTAITINQTPAAIITYASPLKFCEGGAVTLNTSAATNTIYNWHRNSTIIAGANTTSYITSQSGTYTVRVENTQTGCFRMSDAVTVVSNPLPLATVLYNPATNMLSTSQAYATYQWYRNTQPLTGATQSTYSPQTNGAYAVSVTDTNGCTNLSPFKFVSSLAIANPAAAQTISIYPNPASGLITIKAAVAVEVLMQDLSGRIIPTVVTNNTIDVSNLSDGIYMMKILTKEGQILKTEKVVKVSGN